LVGVTLPDDELIAVDRFGDEPPMVVVEASGSTDRGVDVERGVVQAHDRLDEANAAYVAAPVGAVSQSNRTLARELNVGVLAVTADGGVQAIEVPRVVGNRTTTETSAIRFQASAQGVTDRSFSLNRRVILCPPAARDSAKPGRPAPPTMTQTIEISDELGQRIEDHRQEDESYEELIAELVSMYETEGAFLREGYSE